MPFGDWLADFIPDEDTSPEKMKNWRKRLALVSCSAWLILFGCVIPVLVAVLFTGAPMIGRVAWADEENRKIDEKAAQVVAPIQQKLDALTVKMSDMSDLVYDQVTGSLASSICRYSVRRAKETDPDERARLLNQIQEMRQKYKRYAGIEFDLKDC